MILIDYTYFRGEISVAQVSQATVRELLESYISKYEPMFLKQLLGLRLYTAFMDGLNPISGEIPERWLDLKDGVIYEHNGRDLEWMGFTNDDHLSSIANYVYYLWTQKEVQQTTGMGQVKPAGENGTIVSALPKLIRSWNEMVQWNFQCIQYLNNHRDLYPEWRPYWNQSEYEPFYVNGCPPPDYFFGDYCYRNNIHVPEVFRNKNSLGL